MIAHESKIGLGIYSIADAARIVGVQGQRLRKWLDEKHGIVRSRYGKDAVSFLDLMELMFIKMFRDEEVSLQTIRKAAQKASEKFNTGYPFTVKRFDTDGKTIFATLMKAESSDEMIEDLRHGQLVFTQVIKPFFKKLEYDKQDAMKFWPLFKKGRVVLDPQRNFGNPIDFATGVPTSTLFKAVRAGDSPKRVAEWFDVPLKAVEQAVKYEISL